MNCFVLWCGHFQRQRWVYYVPASWVPYNILRSTNYVIRPFPLRGLKVLHPVQMIQLDRHPWRPQNKHKTKKRYPGCLAHEMFAGFNSVVAKLHPPNLCIQPTQYIQAFYSVAASRRRYPGFRCFSVCHAPCRVQRFIYVAIATRWCCVSAERRRPWHSYLFFCRHLCFPAQLYARSQRSSGHESVVASS